MRDLDPQYPSCPVRNILGRMGDKWSLLVIRTIYRNGTIRYNELQKSIPDISQKMLSYTLRHLEEDHLIVRKVYPEVPPRVEYSLSEIGHELMPSLQMMVSWAQSHFNEITR